VQILTLAMGEMLLGRRHFWPTESRAASDTCRRLANGSPRSAIAGNHPRAMMPEAEWPALVQEMRKFLTEPGRHRTNGLPLDELTPRERAVLEAIADGLDNAEIANTLGLSEKTVRNHVTRVFDKIRVQHRYQAIVRARDAGLGTRAR